MDDLIREANAEIQERVRGAIRSALSDGGDLGEYVERALSDDEAPQKAATEPDLSPVVAALRELLDRPQRPIVKTVHRDYAGRITKITEEPADG